MIPHASLEQLAELMLGRTCVAMPPIVYASTGSCLEMVTIRTPSVIRMCFHRRAMWKPAFSRAFTARRWALLRLPKLSCHRKVLLYSFPDVRQGLFFGVAATSSQADPGTIHCSPLLFGLAQQGISSPGYLGNRILQRPSRDGCRAKQVGEISRLSHVHIPIEADVRFIA